MGDRTLPCGRAIGPIARGHRGCAAVAAQGRHWMDHPYPGRAASLWRSAQCPANDPLSGGFPENFPAGAPPAARLAKDKERRDEWQHRQQRDMARILGVPGLIRAGKERNGHETSAACDPSVFRFIVLDAVG